MAPGDKKMRMTIHKFARCALNPSGSVTIHITTSSQTKASKPMTALNSRSLTLLHMLSIVFVGVLNSATVLDGRTEFGKRDSGSRPQLGEFRALHGPSRSEAHRPPRHDPRAKQVWTFNPGA